MPAGIRSRRARPTMTGTIAVSPTVRKKRRRFSESGTRPSSCSACAAGTSGMMTAVMAPRSPSTDQRMHPPTGPKGPPAAKQLSSMPGARPKSSAPAMKNAPSSRTMPVISRRRCVRRAAFAISSGGGGAGSSTLSRLARVRRGAGASGESSNRSSSCEGFRGIVRWVCVGTHSGRFGRASGNESLRGEGGR